MEWYEDAVRALARAHTQAPPPAGATVFYGSSSLRLWTTLADDLVPWPVLNRAFGGSTLAACVHFFARLVPPCAPGSLLIYAGDNDLGDGRPVAAVVASLHALLTQIDSTLGPIPVAFMSIKPSPARWELRRAISQVNDAARQALMARPLGQFIDMYHPMLGRDGHDNETIYFYTPCHFLPQLSDPQTMDALRRMEITLAVGEEDLFLANNQRLSSILWNHGVADPAIAPQRATLALLHDLSGFPQ